MSLKMNGGSRAMMYLASLMKGLCMRISSDSCHDTLSSRDQQRSFSPLLVSSFTRNYALISDLLRTCTNKFVVDLLFFLRSSTKPSMSARKEERRNHRMNVGNGTEWRGKRFDRTLDKLMPICGNQRRRQAEKSERREAFGESK